MSSTDDTRIEQRLSDLEIELAHVVAVVNVHADLFRSIGALTEVLAVEVGPTDG